MMLFRSLVVLFALAFAAALQAEKPAMETRTFKVPQDFLSCDGPHLGAPAPAGDPIADPIADPFAPTPAPAPAKTSPAPPADPFGTDLVIPAMHEESARPPRARAARGALEAMGVTFSEGASASFNPLTSILTVTNTQENLELTAAYMGLLETEAPVNVAFSLTVIEGPGDLIRAANDAASEAANAAPALATLLDHAKRPTTQVRVVGDGFLETKSGTRATLEAVLEHRHATEFLLDAKSQASILQEIEQAGLSLEIEPTVGADRATVEITYALRLTTVPPAQRQVSVNDPFTGHVAEFPQTEFTGAKFVSRTTTLAGHAKLLGVTKPIGTPKAGTDTLWAAFLTTTVRRVEALPFPQPQPTAATPSPLPPGMILATVPAPEGLFTPVLTRPKAVTLESWLSRAGITFPAGASTQQKDGLLHLVNTPDNVGLIAAVVDDELRSIPETAAFTLHTIEAPAALLRDLTAQTLAKADDSAIFAAVEAAAARGEARFINSAFVETKSGTRAVHQAACEHHYVDGFRTDEKGRPVASFESRMVGSHLEIEPLISRDNRTVDVTFSYELNPTAPVLRHDAFRAPASQQRFEMPVTDFHVHKTTTGISVSKGSTKLLSLNAPTGRDTPGVLWATFLKCDVVPQVAIFPDAVPVVERPPQADPKAVNTRTFRVPPDFLSISGDTPHRNTAKMILEAQGVTFPEGSMASFNPALARLFVRNTNENLDLVEAFVTSTCICTPKTVAVTTHVLQGPAGLLRRLAAQAAPKSNHRAELEELLAAVKADTVQHLDTARIETRSGTRATTEQVTQHSAITAVSVNEKGTPLITQESRHVGLRMELEPAVGADGATVELTLAPEFHTAPPYEHREHWIDTQGRRHEVPLTDYHTAQVTTGITLPDGMVRLLSLHKPTGTPDLEKEDVLQVIFITCDILPLVD